MTKEENIATLNEHLEHWKRLLSEKICDHSYGEKTIDALQNAIKALEQEPCGDCISRQAVINAIKNYASMLWEKYYEQVPESTILEMIQELPSVTPQPKVGRWKRINKEKYVQHAMSYYRCSECGKDIIGTHNYCPNCGCKMQEVKE